MPYQCCRPCFFPVSVVDSKGKIKKIYPFSSNKPQDLLTGLPEIPFIQAHLSIRIDLVGTRFCVLLSSKNANLAVQLSCHAVSVFILKVYAKDLPRLSLIMYILH